MVAQREDNAEGHNRPGGEKGETRDRHSHSLGEKRKKDEGSDIKESGVQNAGIGQVMGDCDR